MLTAARDIGALGTAPIDRVIRHALGFADALENSEGRVLDLGSGAGVPGLIVAAARPDLQLVLLDRRQSRADALLRATRSLGWSERVVVLSGDARSLVEQPGHLGGYSAVISRGFGPPGETLRVAARAVRSGGVIVISEPPGPVSNRWTPALLRAAAGVDRRITPPEPRGSVAVFHVEHVPA